MFLFLVKQGVASNLRPKRRGGKEKRKKRGKKKEKKATCFTAVGGSRMGAHGLAHGSARHHPDKSISLPVLSGLTDHLQKLMQCIYILDTLYLFEVTYVIYLDTIVCHLRNAFFLFLFFFFFNFIY